MSLSNFPRAVQPFYQWTVRFFGTTILLSLVLITFTFRENDNLFLSFGFGVFSFYLDRIGLIFFLMVAIIGLIVIRFSKNYLWGDPFQKLFIQKLLYTIVLVQFLVISGDLITFFITWFFSGFGLRQLLSLYKDRKYAVLTARKKIFNANLSALFLLIAFISLYGSTGTIQLPALFQWIQEHSSSRDRSLFEVAGILLVLAAGIKSVNIPFHGWILGVMEAPTPVSGILHAGLINAGPFMMIRFHPLLQETIHASNLLVLWGGLSALFGTLVSFYQPAVKTRLSYSSVGHMGFSLMLSGLGLFSAALLHLIGHSFYKAHTFLSSGSEIDKYRLIHTKRIHFSPYTLGNLFLGLFLSFFLFVGFLYLFKKTFFPSYAFLVLGMIIAMGISTFLMHTAIYFRFWKGVTHAIGYASFIFLSFFFLEWLAEFVVQNPIKEVPVNSFTFWVTTFILLSFLTLAFYSVLLRWRIIPPIPKWDVFIRNGFYLHTLYDRFLFLFISRKTQK